MSRPELNPDLPVDPLWDRLHASLALRGWRPAEFQLQTWRAFLRGESGLLHAPTGSGKTLAVWGGALLATEGCAPAGLRVLWITPLRALANDTAAQLQSTLAGLDLSLQVGLRTADTSNSERTRQRRQAPFALITTPESLSLLLSYADTAALCANLDVVIVDEWHELLGSKRGVQLELCLARLRRWRPALKVWGVSATLGNLRQAMDVLLAGRPGTLIEGPPRQAPSIDSALPNATTRYPWAGHLGLSQLATVLNRVLGARTALVFTNTRSQAELWFEALRAVWPMAEDTLALHHGSLARELRQEVEAGLREQRLRCVIATSTLDLGVDFPAVDVVVQIGSPKGVARLLQRSGRSGHQPGGHSQLCLIATHALELLEVAAARAALGAGVSEPREPIALCLDVLAQHLVTLAVGGGYAREEALAEVRQTHAYAELGERDFQRVLDLIMQGGDSLARYPDFRRVECVDGRYLLRDRRQALRHRWSIGTIVADGHMDVRYVAGGRLGSVEEGFIARLKPGDRFQFAGRTLELVRVRDMVAQVRRASGRSDAVPQWMGGRMPLSNRLADAMRALLDQYEQGRPTPHPEIEHLRPLLDLQRSMSALPGRDRLLVESLRSRTGHHLALYPFAGRLVHEGLAPLLALRLGSMLPTSFSYSVNDYGLMLTTAKAIQIDEPGLRRLLTPAGLDADLRRSLNLAELARRQFRDVAQIAGLTFNGSPAQRRSLRQLQSSAGLLYDVLRAHDPDHVLLGVAEREVCEHQLEARRLHQTLSVLHTQGIDLKQPAVLTPLAFPLWAERIRGQLSHEDWSSRVRAMAERMEART